MANSQAKRKDAEPCTRIGLPAAPEPVELTILMPCLNEAETLATCIQKAQALPRRLRHFGRGADRRQWQHRRLAADRQRAWARAWCRSLARATARRCSAASPPPAAATSSWATPTIPTISPTSTPSSTRLRAGADLVMGNRFKGGIAAGAMPPLHRYLGNPVLTFLGRLFFGIEGRRLPLRPARLQRDEHPRRSTCRRRAWSSPARWWCAARWPACASRRCRPR